MPVRAHRAALLALLLASLLALPAAGSPRTLKRSVSNLVQGPLDVLLSPVVAGDTLITNLRDIDDTMAVRVVYTVPGYFWLWGMEIGGGLLRMATGAIELVPGILLLPFEADIDELFDPVSRADAMFEFENPLSEDPEWLQYMVPLYPFITNYRFGIAYTSAGF